MGGDDLGGVDGDDDDDHWSTTPLLRSMASSDFSRLKKKIEIFKSCSKCKIKDIRDKTALSSPRKAGLDVV